jgi:hypothetical protein
MLEPASDFPECDEAGVGNFGLRARTTSGRFVVSSRVGNGVGLKVLEVGRDNVSDNVSAE